jgi:hypothetical protein
MAEALHIIEIVHLSTYMMSDLVNIFKLSFSAVSLTTCGSLVSQILHKWSINLSGY